MILSPQGLILDSNPSAQTQLGKTEKELLERSFFGFIHADHSNRASQISSQLQSQDSSALFECRVLNVQGQYTWISWSVTTDEERSRLYLVGRPRTEKASPEHQGLEQILDAFHEHIIVAATDERGKITYANRKFTEISGYPIEELLSKDHRILNSKTHDKSFFADLWKTIKSGKSWIGEICNRRKDGSLYWVRTLIVPVKDSQGDIQSFVSFRFDITEEKRSRSVAIANSRMIAVGEMSGGIAHEINNPLAIISGKAQLMRRFLTDTEKNKAEIERSVDRIVETSEGISQVIKSLLSFAREGSNDPFEVTSIDTLAKETTRFCERRFRNHQIEIRLNPNLVGLQVECRQIQISQALLNLLSNSFDSVSEQPGAWVEISAEDCGAEIEIQVTDSGNGIPESIRHQVMEPFFTTKAPGKGTGLGLSISDGLIKSHGGSIRIDESCSNTRFLIRLPKKQPAKSK